MDGASCNMKQKKQTVTQARKHPATAQPAPILSEIHIDDDQDGDQDDAIRSISRTQCGNPACKKYFGRTEAFDSHRVGDYGGPIETNGHLLRFKKPPPRCLTVACKTT